ncbi:MAG: DUF58 domain-containing protein, partial [Cellulomonadaceae bacterium]
MDRSTGQMRVTARGLTVLMTGLVLLAGGLWARYPAVIGLGAAACAAMLVAAVGAAVPIPLGVARAVRPARVSRGEPCAAEVTVTNRSRWSALSVAGHDEVAGAAVPFRVPRLGPGRSSTVRVEVPTHRRGVIAFGPLEVRRSSWADLLGVDRRYGSFAHVVVEPAVHDALGLPGGSRRGHVGADERVEHGGTDLVGLREYVPGDDLRRLHWATSARQGALMVREDADPSAPHLTVLLDDSVDAYDDDGFEEAVDVAASLLATAAAGGAPARLVTVSAAVEVDCLASTEPAPLDPAALDALTRVTTTRTVHGPARLAALERALGSGTPDVLAVVTGARGDVARLVLEAERAASGAVLVVDP